MFSEIITATLTGNQMLNITTGLHNQANKEIASAESNLKNVIAHTDSLPGSAALLNWTAARLKTEYATALKSEKAARFAIEDVKTRWNSIFAALSLTVRV